MPIPASRDLGGDGHPPLVILHGFLGSSRNWLTAGRDLAANFHVHALDLRNHGESFHAREMDFPDLAGDVIAWLDAHGIERTHLLGHSLGGKVAMRVACTHRARVSRLVVVDIAPKDYPPSHEAEFAAMHALDLERLGSRQEAEEEMAPFVRERAMRQFLLTNLERDAAGAFRWSIDLPVLSAARPQLEKNSLAPDDRFEGEALFVIGGDSAYFATGDEEAARRHFPRARFVTIPGSGHNPHFTARERFVGAVREFLNE